MSPHQDAPASTNTGPDQAAARLQALFAAAVELPESQRGEMLERECAGDAKLLAELRELLDMDEQLRSTTVQPIARGLVSLIAASSPDASLTGMRVGPYELREELGRGGMGLVYRGERVDGDVSQQVAVKFLRRDLLDSGTMKRFLLERQALASLDHPNIARLFDTASLDDGTPYYVMEYVSGVSITDYCAKQGLSVRERVMLVRQVCAAVTEAHRHLIVHRDIKPSNILVNTAGVPKLLDFGIAKPLGATQLADVEQTATAQRYFSPLYAAPEQLLGGPIGVACDVYTLGLLLYEVLTGRRPFDFTDKSAGQIERLITTVPPTAPSVCASLNRVSDREVRQLRGDLDDIVLRCLRKAPGERYASVEQLEADLGNYLHGRPVSARGGHGWYRLRKFVGRHRLSVGIIGAAASALVAAAFVLASQNVALTRERDRAQHAVDFLKDAFLAADPAHVAGADVSARQILEATRPKLDALFENEPALYASLAETIGEVELAVGLAPQAAELSGRAIDAARRAQMADPQLRDLLVMHANALSGSGKVDDAAVRLEQAASLEAQITPEWKLAQGRLLCARGRAPEAIPLLERALDELSRRSPRNELATNVRLQLAEALRLQDQFDRSLAVLDETLRWQRAELAPNHPMILRTRLRRIELLRQHGRKDEALAEAQSVVSEVERFYGLDTSYAAVAKTSLGMALDEFERYTEAAGAYRDALKAWRRAVGNEHGNTIRAMANLAESLARDPAKEAEATALYDEVLDSATRMYGAADEMSVYIRLNYGDLLLTRKRFKQALTLLTAAAGVEGLKATKFNHDLYLDELGQAIAGANCNAPGGKSGKTVSPAPDCLIAAGLVVSAK